MNPGCGGCSQIKNCRIHWGRQCREKGGKKVPRYIKAPRLPRRRREELPAPADAIASIYWIDGGENHYTAAQLDIKEAQG